VQLFDEETAWAQVAGGRGEAELDHPVVLLGEEDEELVLLHGHSLQPGGQGRPRILAHQARVQVNKGQQAVNLLPNKGKSEGNHPPKEVDISNDDSKF
jgi:hypothetical protein